MVGLLQRMKHLASVLPAIVLTLLVFATPWAFGGVTPTVEWTVSLVVLVAAAVGLLAAPPRRLEAPLVLFVAFCGVALLQLVPLPPALHAFAAPASARVWHPADPVAAAVLGNGWRPVSIDPESTLRSLAWALGLLGLVAGSLPTLRRRSPLIGMTVVLVVAGSAVAAFGVVGRIVFGERLYGVLAVPTVSPFGPFVSKNHFAGFVELAALLALGLAAGLVDELRREGRLLGWLDSRRSWRPLAALAAAAAIGLAVLLSQSRGGAVSLGAGIGAFLVVRRLVRSRSWRRRDALVPLGLVLVAASAWVTLPPAARERLLSLGSARPDSSASYRLGVWRDGLRAAAASPAVGHGLGSFERALPPFKRAAGELRVEHAENDYLEVLVDTGAAGLILALGAALLLGAVTLQGLRAQDDRLVRGIGMGAVAGLSALAIHSAGDFNLRIPSNALLAASLAALALGASRFGRARGGGGAETIDEAGGFSSPRCGIAFALILLGVLVPFAALGPRRDTGIALPARALPTGLRLRSVESELVEALRRTPTDARLWLGLAWTRGTQGTDPRPLIQHARWCDPSSPRIRSEADRLERGFSSR